MWKTVGDPGAVLADGRIGGTWHPRKRGRTPRLTLDAFEPLSGASAFQLEFTDTAVG